MNPINLGQQTIRGKITEINQDSIYLKYQGSSFDRPGQSLTKVGEEVELTDISGDELAKYQVGQVVIAKGLPSYNLLMFEKTDTHQIGEVMRLTLSAPYIQPNRYDPLGADRLLTGAGFFAVLVLALLLLALRKYQLKPKRKS